MAISIFVKTLAAAHARPCRCIAVGARTALRPLPTNAVAPYGTVVEHAPQEPEPVVDQPTALLPNSLPPTQTERTIAHERAPHAP
jgi:hypothetical protein